RMPHRETERERQARRAPLTTAAVPIKEKGPGLLPGPQVTFPPAFSEFFVLLLLLLVILARALLGLGVVVAALQRDPVRLDVLAARQEVRPRVARNQALGLPDCVELAIRTHFADEHGLGQVVVRQHLGD